MLWPDWLLLAASAFDYRSMKILARHFVLFCNHSFSQWKRKLTHTLTTALSTEMNLSGGGDDRFRHYKAFQWSSVMFRVSLIKKWSCTIFNTNIKENKHGPFVAFRECLFLFIILSLYIWFWLSPSLWKVKLKVVTVLYANSDKINLECRVHAVLQREAWFVMQIILNWRDCWTYLWIYGKSQFKTTKGVSLFSAWSL